MNLVSIEKNKNNLVVKHQELVRNARYSLSELGIKVVSVLISMIKVKDTEFTQYAIQLKDFKELIGSDSKNTYKYAHNLIRELMSNPIKIGDEQFNWVSYGKYAHGEAVIIFEIHRLLKPYLLQLQEKFLEYNITNILLLKSAYVIRFYELCRDYLTEVTRYNNVKSVTFELEIAQLRELFEIPDSYQYSSHIKKHIIDKAMIQFKAKTDIQMSYREHKVCRRVDKIIVTVSDNDKTDIFEAHKKKIAKRQKFIDVAKKKKAEKMIKND